MNIKAEAAKGRRMLLFWRWSSWSWIRGPSNLGQLWETLPLWNDPGFLAAVRAMKARTRCS